MSYLLNAPEMKVYVNGNLAGYVTGLSYRVMQGQKPIFGVDSPFPQEIAQGASPVYVEGSFTVLRPKEGSPETWGMMTPRTSNDGAKETGDPSSTALGSAKYSTIEILDRQTDARIIKIFSVMFSAQDWNVVAKGIMSGTITFQGIGVIHAGMGLT